MSIAPLCANTMAGGICIQTEQAGDAAGGERGRINKDVLVKGE